MKGGRPWGVKRPDLYVRGLRPTDICLGCGVIGRNGLLKDRLHMGDLASGVRGRGGVAATVNGTKWPCCWGIEKLSALTEGVSDWSHSWSRSRLAASFIASAFGRAIRLPLAL